MYIYTDYVTETKRYVPCVSAQGDINNPNVFEVAEIPPFPDPVPGTNFLRFYNPSTGEFWYEEEEVPLTPEEQQVQQNQEILDTLDVMLS